MKPFEYNEPVILIPNDSALGKCSSCDFMADTTIILGANTETRQLINFCADCAQMLYEKLSSFIEEGLSDLDAMEEDDGEKDMADDNSENPESIPYGEMGFTQEDINESGLAIPNAAQFVEEDTNKAIPSNDCTKPIECEGD